MVQNPVTIPHIFSQVIVNPVTVTDINEVEEEAVFKYFDWFGINSVKAVGVGR